MDVIQAKGALHLVHSLMCHHATCDLGCLFTSLPATTEAALNASASLDRALLATLPLMRGSLPRSGGGEGDREGTGRLGGSATARSSPASVDGRQAVEEECSACYTEATDGSSACILNGPRGYFADEEALRCRRVGALFPATSLAACQPHAEVCAKSTTCRRRVDSNVTASGEWFTRAYGRALVDATLLEAIEADEQALRHLRNRQPYPQERDLLFYLLGSSRPSAGRGAHRRRK